MSCFFDNLLPIMFALEVYVTEEVYITKRKINKISNFKQQQHKIHITCFDYNKNFWRNTNLKKQTAEVK